MGMILADTTVWVDHFRKPEPGLLEHLAMNGVLMHPMVIGELACGNLPNRRTVLHELLSLPQIPEPTHESVLSFIESKELMGRGGRLHRFPPSLLRSAPERRIVVDPGQSAEPDCRGHGDSILRRRIEDERMAGRRKQQHLKAVETLTHEGENRRNIPTASA